MVTLFRHPRPMDRHLGTVLGEVLTPVTPNAGPLEGMTVLIVGPEVAQALIDGGGGWTLHVDEPVRVEEVDAVIRGHAVLAYDLAALEAYLDATGLARRQVRELQAAESAKPKPRRGALALFAAWLAAHPSDGSEGDGGVA